MCTLLTSDEISVTVNCKWSVSPTSDFLLPTPNIASHFLVLNRFICDSLYCCFSNTDVSVPVQRAAVLGGRVLARVL